MQPEDDAAGAADTAVDTPSYTKDTPMEDILQVMTLEQAQQVIVDDGICKGMTIAQVAEKRPVNLRYYLIPGKSKKQHGPRCRPAGFEFASKGRLIWPRRGHEGRNDRWAPYPDEFPFGIMEVVELLHLRVRRQQANSVYVDCPFCGDRRGRMNVNFVKNVWRCNHCDEHGGMLALYAKLNHTTTSDAYWEIAEALCDNTHEGTRTLRE